jgi:hypothetical protein
MKKNCLLIVLLFLSFLSFAQKAHYTASDYTTKPVWIEMIKDTSANYFEVEKAYDTYFRSHTRPGGEHDVIGERDERVKHLTKKQQKKIQAENHMRMEVKKYERWHDKMRPYVQQDGSILTPSQRLKIWEQNKNK